MSPNQYFSHQFTELPDTVGGEAKIAGHVKSVRDHGQVLFVDLRDTSRSPLTLQLVVRGTDLMTQWRDIPAESAVSVTGIVQRRQSVQSDATGLSAVEMSVKDVVVVNRARSIAFRPGDDSVTEEVGLSNRYLTLRDGPVRDAVLKRDKFLEETRRGARDLLHLPEVQTPIITGPSPEGARDYLVPSRRYPGQFYALPQAPQQFKELLMASGFPGYFQIAPCFRDEDARADRTPFEHYQLDIEFPWVEQEDVFGRVEALVRYLAERCSDLETNGGDFERITYQAAMDRFGSDKPDLRFELEIQDLSTFVSEDEVAFLRTGFAAGNILRGITIPGGAALGRKWLDATLSSAKPGVTKTWLTLGDEGLVNGPLGKHLSPDLKSRLSEALNLKSGDALIVAAGPFLKTCEFLARVRNQIGEDLSLADPHELKFAWVTDFPHYEWDEAASHWVFNHNPFSRPQGDMESLKTQAPGEVLAYQYDLTCNGVELGSGALRNFDPDVMVEAFRVAGYEEQQVRNNFPAMYNALRSGMPPHGGIGLGVDRMLALFHGLRNVRDGIAFPPTQTGRDVLVTAPQIVGSDTLVELGLQLNPIAVPHLVTQTATAGRNL